MNENRRRAIDILMYDVQRKSSKARIGSAIEDAISAADAGAHTTVESLLELYGLKYKDTDLKECARNFAVDMANDETWQAYHA